MSFLGVCFMFSKTHDFNRSPCLNLRTFAQKKQQMLEELKKVVLKCNFSYNYVV